MGSNQAQPDLTMEDVLSSIREAIENDLIKDDTLEVKESADVVNFDHKKTPQPQKSDETKEESTIDGEKDILELTQEIRDDGSIINIRDNGTVAEKSKNAQATPDATRESRAEKGSASKDKGGKATVSTKQERLGEDPAGEQLVSDKVLSESSEALAGLASMAKLIAQSKNAKTFDPGSVGHMTVESVMRELLKPMLKDWLDSHLPSLVKWLVTEQIEKMLRQSGINIQKSAASEDTKPAEISQDS